MARVGYPFGGTSGNTSFESDGTLLMAGAATVWTDIDFPIIIRTTGTNIPVISAFQGNLTSPKWQVNDYAVAEGQELVHSWKEGTEVFWHVHVFTSVQDATDRYVKFEVEYTWGNFNTTLPANAIITSPDLLIPANTAPIHHLIFSIGSFTPTGGKIGAHVKARLKRVASTGTAPSADVFCEMLQLHIESDTIGSRAITTK